jgi:predicted GIY-YIG superfamily endonuclease
MRDSADKVVYVGKAKDLRQRLNNYRVANPDRMPRRHLRMVREVKRIEFQFCANESSALAREAKLLRALKPKFNRAGVWPGKTRFIAWRVQAEQLQIKVVETPETGWQRFGPMGSNVHHLQRSIARLLWLAIHQNHAVNDLPSGWAQGRFMEVASIHCGELSREVATMLESFFWGRPEMFSLWLGSRFAARTIPFERGVIQAELEMLEEHAFKRSRQEEGRQQLALL